MRLAIVASLALTALLVVNRPLWMGGVLAAALLAIVAIWTPMDARDRTAPLALIAAGLAVVLAAAHWRGLPF